MSGAVARLKEEISKILISAAFFSTGFSIIVLCDRLLTEGTGIEVASFARALVGGLIVAKVLLSVNLLPFVHAFPHKPLAHNIGWKSLLYVIAAVVFLYIEPFLKGLFKGAGLYVAHSHAWHELMLPRTWAKLIWLTALLVVFVTMQELSRVIGKEEFKRLFFGRRARPVAEQRFRDAA